LHRAVASCAEREEVIAAAELPRRDAIPDVPVFAGVLVGAPVIVDRLLAETHRGSKDPPVGMQLDLTARRDKPPSSRRPFWL
jgi:hypothetical protein